LMTPGDKFVYAARNRTETNCQTILITIPKHRFATKRQALAAKRGWFAALLSHHLHHPKPTIRRRRGTGALLRIGRGVGAAAHQLRLAVLRLHPLRDVAAEVEELLVLAARSAAA